jgi:hypothetical protein
MCIVDGVIVAAPQFAHHLASILRDAVVELSRAKLSEKGKEEKTQEVYRYLRSEEFKNALQVIDGERRNCEGNWREKNRTTKVAGPGESNTMPLSPDRPLESRPESTRFLLHSRVVTLRRYTV